MVERSENWLPDPTPTPNFGLATFVEIEYSFPGTWFGVNYQAAEAMIVTQVTPTGAFDFMRKKSKLRLNCFFNSFVSIYVPWGMVFFQSWSETATTPSSDWTPRTIGFCCWKWLKIIFLCAKKEHKLFQPAHSYYLNINCTDVF